ncbi:DUF2279 domain-containing protein [Mariniflexile ostreae]|uniref:DUF2279 domain-containing protein n=1 Tax=Mariniflexile ostreae TaxID=1520892 RepID=A0ABV5FEZ1_9FLAO
MKRSSFIYALFFLLLPLLSLSQIEAPVLLKSSEVLNKTRRDFVVITEAALASISLIALDQLWYQEYARSKFHTINDNQEWFQMDKMGHAFTAYQLGRFGAETLNWSGVSKKNQLLYGGTLGFGFLTAVEVLDGFSKEWGFSWGDIAANAAGTGLYIGQELLWNEQRVALKFSFHQTKYASQRPDKLGNGLLEEVLKDYNGQTYWLSINLHAFFKDSQIPKWFNIALGYGAEGMLTGVSGLDDSFMSNQDRMAQYYLSFDVNLKKIKTNSAFLKSVFSIFNSIKIPFPALEFNKERCVFHLFYN